MSVIDDLTAELASLAKAIADAYEELNEAEAAWDELADDVAQTLREEAENRGSKAAPAEHTIVSATRRENRKAYQRLRRAKREIAKLEVISQNRRAELSGQQTRIREQVPSQQRQGPRAVAS